MKRPPKTAGIIVGAFVAPLIIIASLTGCGGAKASPAATTTATTTATATPTATAAPARTPAAAATAKAQPKRTQTAPVTSRAAAPPPPPPPPPPPHTTAPAAAPAPPPPTKPAGCYPLTNGGNCYEPGEYCRNADHGVSGVAGDGEAITCADNNGWRWEPS